MAIDILESDYFFLNLDFWGHMATHLFLTAQTSREV